MTSLKLHYRRARDPKAATTKPWTFKRNSRAGLITMHSAAQPFIGPRVWRSGPGMRASTCEAVLGRACVLRHRVSESARSMPAVEWNRGRVFPRSSRTYKPVVVAVKSACTRLKTAHKPNVTLLSGPQLPTTDGLSGTSARKERNTTLPAQCHCNDHIATSRLKTVRPEVPSVPI